MTSHTHKQQEQQIAVVTLSPFVASHHVLSSLVVVCLCIPLCFAFVFVIVAASACARARAFALRFTVCFGLF